MSLVFQHRTLLVSIYARGEYLVVRTLNDAVLCVRVHVRVTLVLKVLNDFERNGETERKRTIFSSEDKNPEAIRGRRCRRNSRGKNDGRKKKKSKTYLAGAQLD